ncbi:hypothetical protein PHLCEN_2v7282, partial [Hermanssonia centrifuga]
WGDRRGTLTETEVALLLAAVRDTKDSRVLGVFHMLKNNIENQTVLAGQVQKSFQQGRIPSTSVSDDGFSIYWVRKNARVAGSKEKELLAVAKGGFRYHGVDFINFGAPVFFWPPALTDVYQDNLAVDASAMWIVTWEGNVGEKELDDIRAVIPAREIFAFRLFNRAGSPSTQWGIRAIGIPAGLKGTDVKIGNKVDLTWAPHCAFCGRGAPLETPHSHEQCPQIGVQNKFREQAGYYPIKVTDRGYIERLDVEIPEDLPKAIKGLRGRLEKVEGRLDKLEKPDKADDKKRKADAAPEASTATPKKKAKKDKKKKAKQGQGSGAAAPTNAKGKGKAST